MGDEYVVDHHIIQGLRLCVASALGKSPLIVVEGEAGRGLIVALVAEGMIEQALSEVDRGGAECLLLADETGLSQGLEGLGVVEEIEEIHRPLPQKSFHFKLLGPGVLLSLAEFGGPIVVDHGRVALSGIEKGGSTVEDPKRWILHGAAVAFRSPCLYSCQGYKEGQPC